MIFSLTISAFAVRNSELTDAISNTAKYIHQTVSDPLVGSIGGEWAVMGLARSGQEISKEYYHKYYETVEKYVRDCKGNLHDKKYTEYSRLIVALTSIGKDPTNVAGYNLLIPLGDYEKTIWQGMNGSIWALIALDSGNYTIPKNPNAKVQATREMYVNRILECRLPDGGWSLFGGTESQTSNETSDPDITGMALQALAKYLNQLEVERACDEALDCMSKKQSNSGGFGSWGTENSESCVQMIVALCELGISLEDSRFVKNGNTMLDNLMSFYMRDNGFMHTKDGGGNNQMATEQGFYGLVAAQRALTGKSSLYRMTDAINIGDVTKDTPIAGLSGKHKDVKTPDISLTGKTFSDIKGHENQQAIEALTSRRIINGKTESEFDPNAIITRAEFATIIVKSLGFKPKENRAFTDVKINQWFATFIGTANSYGIVNGTTATTFNPNGTVTREEAATMVTKAAELCGMDTDYEAMPVRDILCQFTDYLKCSKWATAPLAFCYDSKIMDSSAMTIEPKTPIKRCEVAQMLFNMLSEAELLK